MGIKGYHSTEMPGRGNKELDIKTKQRLVGIEFETELEARSRVIERVETVFADKEVKFYPEDDGSLSRDRGVEFVSSPMPASVALSKKGPLNALLSTISSAEVCKSRPNIGMHVNVSADSEQHALATAIFGNLLANISRRVAGRGDVYSTHNFYGDLLPDSASAAGKGYAVACRFRRVTGPEYICPLSGLRFPAETIKTEWRNEFRCHRSTTNFKLAKIQVHYSVLVSEFSKMSMPLAEEWAGKRLDMSKITRTEEAFARFVESKRTKNNSVTNQLLAIIQDKNKTIWDMVPNGWDGRSPAEYRLAKAA